MHYLLLGNYGTGNLGDEALKDYFLKAFPEVDWKVVSASPVRGALPRFPGGIRSLLSLRWLRTLKALRASDGLVFGGGSLLTDTESVYACLLWWWHAFVARIFRKRILLAFQGIGPFRTTVGEWCARSVCTWADCLSVRDEASLERLKDWKLNKEVVLSFDPVFTLIQGLNIKNRSKNILIIVPRKNSTETFTDRLRELLKQRTWDSIQIISLQPDDPQEQRTCRTLEQLTEGVPCSLVGVHSLEQLIGTLSEGSLILSQRYHGALAAFALGIPVEVAVQREGDKLAALRALFGQHEAHSRVRERLEEGEQSLREALQSP